MSVVQLSTLTWPCPVEARLLPALSAALTARGPVIAVLPAAGDERTVAALRPEVPLERPGIAALVATSGSSGDPKIVLLPADALTASAHLVHDRLGGAGQWLLALPPTGIGGLQVLVRSVVAGTTPVVMDLSRRFDPIRFATATNQLSGDRRYTALVPTQLVRLLGADRVVLAALRSYDAVLVGGTATAPAVLARARSEGIRAVTTYGMTETCGGCVYDGRPLPGVTVRVDEDQVISIGGPTLAAGYRLDPALTAASFANGWFRTSDRGRLDATRSLIVLGRADDAILTGGVTVDPVAVENVLLEHPAVAQAAVIGRPDPEWGERTVAVIVTAGDDRPSLAELRDAVTASLGAAHAPSELVVRDALPTLPTGKLDRQTLRDLVT